MAAKWLMAVAIATGSIMSQAQIATQPVLQRGYDANVSGANLTETTLNASNVTSGAFGLLFKLPVDEKVYAQPLYVPNVAIPNQGTHNVLYVATMNDTLYAFDADVGGTPLWSINLAALVNATAVPWVDVLIPPSTLAGNLGILSTPVIDPSTNILYVVACTLENSTAVYRLHAIDITSGAEPYGPGVLITGSYGGATFDAPFQTQRVSLTLADNQVVFGFAAMQEEEFDTYEGWVMAYNKLTLQQSGVFVTVASGNGGGGVWQAGRPPVVDSAGYVYVFSGNAKGGGYGYNGVNDFSESALKLDPSNGLALVDWFTAGNWSYLDTNDLDLSSSGPLLVPGTSLLAGGGKTGYLYVLNTADLGEFNADDTQIVQKENITAGNKILGGPVYWEGSAATAGPLLYNWGASDVLRAYGFNGSTFATSPSAQGTNSASYPGGILALSANGNVQGSGVLWATTAAIPAAGGNPAVPSALHAFNAENIANELWNSTMNAVRDGYGTLARFMPPMIANGKVYVATWSNQVAVYGFLPYTISPTSLAFGSNTTGVASAAQSVTVTNAGATTLPVASITIAGKNPGQFSQSNTCGASIAVGSACTINVVFKPTSTAQMTATLSAVAGGGAGAPSVTQPVTLTGTGVAPSYTALPTLLTFGSEQVNTSSAAQSVTVTNNGAFALAITSITLSGANYTQFSQTNTCGTPVAAGSTCTINVVFNPTFAGSKTATLSVYTGGSASTTQTVTLAGTSVAPTFTVSPTSLAFGTEQTNSPSPAQLVTVTNEGNGALPIASITLTGKNDSQFSQTNTCGTSVPAGSYCTISVVFAPTSVGSKVATLNVKGGGGADTQTLALTGTGTGS